MGGIHPNVIIIYKNKTKYDSYRTIIQKDSHSRKSNTMGGMKTKCNLLLFNFHTKKNWWKIFYLNLVEKMNCIKQVYIDVHKIKNRI